MPAAPAVVSFGARVVSLGAPVRCRLGRGVPVGGGRTVMFWGFVPVGAMAPGGVAAPPAGLRSAAESAPTGTWPVIIYCDTIWYAGTIEGQKSRSKKFGEITCRL